MPDLQYVDVSSSKNNIYSTFYNNKTGVRKTIKTNKINGLSLYQATKKETEYKSIVGHKNLSKIPFSTISQYKSYLYKYNDVDGYEIYGDFDLENKWISENFEDDIIYDPNIVNVGFFDIETTVTEQGSRNIKENVATAPERITSIVLHSSKSDIYHVFCDKKITGKYFKESDECDENTKLKFYYFSPDFVGEYKMLTKFLEVMNDVEKIDVLSAYFGDLFDVPYIFNRINRLNQTKDNYDELRKYNIYPEDMSPIGVAYTTQRGKLVIKGIQSIDYFEVYKKFTYGSLESWKLDFIATKELGVGKVQFEGGFMELYNNDYEKYVFYNFIDVKRLVQIDEKLKFFELVFEVAYMAKQNFATVLSPVRTWESLIYNNILERNILFNPQEFHEKIKYLGAYTHNPVRAYYNYIMSFDLNSLYPHLIMMYFISPETLLTLKESNELFGKYESYNHIIELRYELEEVSAQVPYDKVAVAKAYDRVADDLLSGNIDMSFIEGTDITMSPALYFFRKDEDAIIPNFMLRLYNIRKKIKKDKLILEDELQQYKDTKDKEFFKKLQNKYKDILEAENIADDIIQMSTYIRRWGLKEKALKILLNSVYGAFGNVYFRLFKLDLAKSITAGGRLAIRSLIDSLENTMRSIYFEFTGKEWKGKDFFIYSDTDSVYINVEPLVGYIIHSYKKLIINSIKKNFGKDVLDEITDSGFFDDPTKHLEEKSDMARKYFNPHDMLKGNGIIEKCIKIEIDENDLLEFKKFYRDIDLKAVYKRRGEDSTIHCFFFGDDVDEYKGIFTDCPVEIKSFNRTYAIDDFGNTIIQDIIDENYIFISKLLNAKNKMVMKRETICVNGFWVGKKNYALSVIDSEGVIYKTPKIKIAGIIKKNNDVSVRNDLVDFIDVLLKQNDITTDHTREILNDYVEDAIDRFKNLPVENQGQNKQVNNIDDKIGHNGMPIKGSAINSIGAIYFNKYIKDNNLKQYVPIQEGEKMKYVYLLPNKYGYHVIGYKDEGLPEEFHSLVDVDMMLEKGLYAMLNIILSSADIELDYSRTTVNIMDFLK